MTFVELAMALAVLAIAAALVAPMMGSTAHSQLHAAASMLAADLDTARVQSVTQSEDPLVVVLDEDGAGYHLARASDPDQPVTHPADAQPYVVRFGQGRAASLGQVSIAAGDGVSEEGVVAFGAFGQMASDEAATLTLTADGEHLNVTLDAATGEAVVAEP